jgi:hypothetical protein
MALPAPLRPVARRANPYVLRMAASVPPWVVVQHVGRRSGHAYRTPVVAFAARAPLDAAPGRPVAVRGARDVLVYVPLPWGADTDWCRNVRAAGRFSLTRRGTEYLVDGIDVVDTAAAEAALGRRVTAAARTLGVRQVLRGTLHRPPRVAV